MRRARLRLALAVGASVTFISTALTGTATAAPRALAGLPLQANAARNNVPTPAPQRLSNGKDGRLSGDCSPAAIAAKLAKAKPLGSNAPAELRGKKIATGLAKSGSGAVDHEGCRTAEPDKRHVDRHVQPLHGGRAWRGARV